MFDNNSDYALNKKDKDSIVYKGCDGSEQRISREQFATEEEFMFWKSWSDEDYRETDYKDAYCSTIIFVEIKTNGRCSIRR